MKRLFELSIIGSLLVSGSAIAAGAGKDVVASYMNAQSSKERVKAVKAMGNANDCDKDCDGAKARATQALVAASQDCGDAKAAAAAAKELRKDLKHKSRHARVVHAMSSQPTAVRVEPAKATVPPPPAE